MADGFDLPVRALTLQRTEIVHDAVTQLWRQRTQIENSGQFFAIAILLIQRVVRDYRERRRAKKRRGGHPGTPLNAAAVTAATIEARDDAASAPVVDSLEQLQAECPRTAEVVTLHIPGGHPLPKVAEMIGMSLAQTERDWSFARMWLKRDLTGSKA
jgi:DNA-directed RNA polymerase specialized sigma24 family protein